MNDEGGWEPIETAPTDGTRMLLYYPDCPGREMFVGAWDISARSAHKGCAQPSDWRPLPEFPERKAQGGEE